MSWSKVTLMLPSGRATIACGGGLVLATCGGWTGLRTSTWCDWLMKTRPSAVVLISSPRVPPVATATCCSVARSTMVSSVPAPGVDLVGVRDEQQAGQLGAGQPKAIESTSVSNWSISLGASGVPVNRMTLVLVVRPGGRPEGAVGCEGQAADAEVAEVGEGVGGRVEDLDAVAGGDVDQAGARLDGQALRQAVAELAEDRRRSCGSSSRSGPPPVVAQMLPAASRAMS